MNHRWIAVGVAIVTLGGLGLWESTANARHGARKRQIVGPSCAVYVTAKRGCVRIETVLSVQARRLPSDVWVADAVTGGPRAFRAHLSVGAKQWILPARRSVRDAKGARLRFGPPRMIGWELHLPGSSRPRSTIPVRLRLIEVRTTPTPVPKAGVEVQVRLPTLGNSLVPLSAVVVEGTLGSGTAVRARTCDIDGYGREVSIWPHRSNVGSALLGARKKMRRHRHLCIRWSWSIQDAGVMDSSWDDASDAGPSREGDATPDRLPGRDT